MESRRSFLGKVTTAAGALLAGRVPTFAEEQEDSIDVNEWMKGVKAEDIAGIEEVVPHPVEGAEKVLVAIEQNHFYEGMNPQEKASLERCQRELYTAINDLRSNTYMQLRSILVEGVVAGNEEEHLRRVERTLRYNLSRVHDGPLVSDFIPMQGPKKSFEEKVSNIRYLTTPLFYGDVKDPNHPGVLVPLHVSTLSQVGTGYILAYRRVFDVRGAEDEEILKTARSIDDEKEPALYRLWANTKREQNVLNKVKEGREQIHYTMFGGRHRWGDSVDEWNRTEEEKISLLTLRTREMVAIQKWLKESGLLDE